MSEIEDIGRVGMNARAEYALERGWTVTPSHRGRDDRSDTYHKRQAHVWDIREGWRRANLIDGKYRDHVTFATFPEALEGEKIG